MPHPVYEQTDVKKRFSHNWLITSITGATGKTAGFLQETWQASIQRAVKVSTKKGWIQPVP
jgi:hypothetical protein